MGKIIEKVKETVTGAKDKVKDVGETTKDKVTSSTSSKDTSSSRGSAAYEQGAAGTETGINDDPLTSYREKEPMTPAKIKEHEPTAVKREMSEKITEPGQIGTNPEEAAEIARKKGMVLLTQQKLEVNTNKELQELVLFSKKIHQDHRQLLTRTPAIGSRAYREKIKLSLVP